MDADQVLAFRLGRSGLVERSARSLADAAACPASDFARDAALLALAARADNVSRDSYREAIEGGDLAVAHVIRGAIHALAPSDLALYGRALIASDDGELGHQLGQQVRRLVADGGLTAGEALDEVAEATTDALAGGVAPDRNELHAALRERVRPELMPWCRSCKSHHVAPMLWRYATVKAGARLDSERRYTLAAPRPTPRASDTLRRFLGFYGPASPGDFADWAGIAKAHARRVWDEVSAELAEVRVGEARGWLLREDVDVLDSVPAARGVRLLPPGDPYLQKPNRSLLAPDAVLRKRLFRPVASPGAVLRDGRLAGLWRTKLKGRKAEVTIEPLERMRRTDLEPEGARVASLRGGADLALVLA
ncbi:MAG TPA: crosslink repair DNA glycosylase YcaQ family protein [Solirubrobacterales bacterium]|nr:crosslink repair DNA glycosylase YcaQ family protein [Solirubrobacterales bacterium]